MIGQWINVCCYKHNGKVHRIWEKVLILDQNKAIIVVGNDTAKVIEKDGRMWQVREPAVTIFFKDKWFNVIAMIRDNGVHFYCNIASPFILKEKTVFYIDYDIDVGMNPNEELRVLDEQEYLRHKKTMGYSETLDLIIKEALNDVLSLMRNKEYPFIEKLVLDYYESFKELKKK